MAKILVTARSLDHNRSAGLDRHKGCCSYLQPFAWVVRIDAPVIRRYPPSFEPHIYRYCNSFDHVEVIWIDMLRNLFLFIVTRLAVGLSQLPELYNA